MTFGRIASTIAVRDLARAEITMDSQDPAA
jgi:hypothetical protein